MKYKYGKFNDEQIEQYKVKLHKELFWLLVYKDPETAKEYENMDFDRHFQMIMRKLDGFNELLFYPWQIVAMMSLLEAALIETHKETFDYLVYRKLILDAHGLIDKINVKGGERKP